MITNKTTSENYYLSLKKRLKKCFNPYNQVKHLEYLKDVQEFSKRCSHQYDSGKSAIKFGIDEETAESWAQCEMCKKNFG